MMEWSLFLNTKRVLPFVKTVQNGFVKGSRKFIEVGRCTRLLIKNPQFWDFVSTNHFLAKLDSGLWARITFLAKLDSDEHGALFGKTRSDLSTDTLFGKTRFRDYEHEPLFWQNSIRGFEHGHTFCLNSIRDYEHGPLFWQNSIRDYEHGALFWQNSIRGIWARTHFLAKLRSGMMSTESLFSKTSIPRKVSTDTVSDQTPLS